MIALLRKTIRKRTQEMMMKKKMLLSFHRCSMLKQKISTKLKSKQFIFLNTNRVVLQRQFFEAIARCAAVKYANRADLLTLADKLDALFK